MTGFLRIVVMFSAGMMIDGLRMQLHNAEAMEAAKKAESSFRDFHNLEAIEGIDSDIFSSDHDSNDTVIPMTPMTPMMPEVGGHCGKFLTDMWALGFNMGTCWAMMPRLQYQAYEAASFCRSYLYSRNNL